MWKLANVFVSLFLFSCKLLLFFLARVFVSLGIINWFGEARSLESIGFPYVFCVCFGRLGASKVCVFLVCVLVCWRLWCFKTIGFPCSLTLQSSGLKPQSFENHLISLCFEASELRFEASALQNYLFSLRFAASDVKHLGVNDLKSLVFLVFWSLWAQTWAVCVSKTYIFYDVLTQHSSEPLFFLCFFN